MTITFERRDGKTLLTMVQTGFDRAEDRDAFQSGWPAYLDSLQSIAGRQIKARHDSGA
jgi:hypothetical protein